jgi:hypothetical protein
MALVVRTSVIEVLPGHRQEAEQIIDSLKEFLSSQKGFILGYRFDLPENPYSIGRSSIWDGEDSSNAAAQHTHVLSLRTKLGAICKKDSVSEHMHYINGTPKNIPKPVS